MNGIEKQYVIDALAEDSWRMFRILGEFVQGFEELADVGKAVTIFGSARLREESDTYNKARELAGQLAKQGYTIVTGGGPGNATTFLSIDLVKMAVGQFDLGPAAAFSIMYFLVILLVSWVFYTVMTNIDRSQADIPEGM